MRNHFWYLKQIKVFSVLTDAQLEVVKDHTFVERVCKGTPIYLPGEAPDAIYLLKEGIVRISRLTEDGDQAPMAILDKGDVFGELEAVDGSVRNDIAEAVGDVLLCVWPRADFLAMLRANPDLHLQVTKTIGRRLRRLQTRVEDLVFRGATERLESLLGQLAEDFGEAHPRGVRIGIALTRDEMARLIGVTRQTVSETLTLLHQAGRLDYDGRRLILTQPDCQTAGAGT